jgi:hypothetical protein
MTPKHNSHSSSANKEEIRTALSEINREGVKLAAIYAVIDAAVVVLLVNVVLTVFSVPVLPDQIPLDPTTSELLSDTLGLGTSGQPVLLSAGVLIGSATGIIVFVAEVWWRQRQPLIEQFEAANPPLRESLRTARDAVRRDADSAMINRLYSEVLNNLNKASSVGLLNFKRIAASLVLVAILSGATIQLAVVDIELTGQQDSVETIPGESETEYDGLQNGSSLLADPTDVPEGEAVENATVSSTGSGDTDGNATDAPSGYQNTGFDSATNIQSQRAAYDSGTDVEDAALIREYNIQIRTETDST